MPMFPFNKKKEDSKDQDKDEVKEKKTRKRRKKAEPPKPWSKKERIIVFVFLVGTFMTSTVLAVRSNQPPALPHPLNETGKVILTIDIFAGRRVSVLLTLTLTT